MKLIKTMGLMLALIVSHNASAGPIAILDTNSPGRIIGIKGLNVGAELLDVSFTHNSFENLFGSPTNLPLLQTPYFFNNATGADIARTAITNFFNSLSPVPTSIPETNAVRIPHTLILTGTNTASPSAWRVSGSITVCGDPCWTDGAGFTNTITERSGYALFSPSSPIPEPEALGLLAIGLLSLAVTRYKQAQPCNN